MTDMHRRSFLIGTATTAALAASLGVSGPALAIGRYRVVDVNVRVSPIVAGRIRTDMPGRIASIIRRRGARSNGPDVRVVVDLRTIDPYRPTLDNVRRGMAVRYSVLDARTGRTLASSRFLERTSRRDDFEGTVLFNTRPITRGTQERELARGTANQILREAL